MQLEIRGQLVEVNATADDLSLGDAEAVEKITGSTLADLNYKAAGTSVALIYVSARRVFPDITLAEIRNLKLSAIKSVAEEAAAPTADGEAVGADPLPSAATVA